MHPRREGTGLRVSDLRFKGLGVVGRYGLSDRELLFQGSLRDLWGTF